MVDLDALDNFLNDASDQAAAWYSILENRPVAIPSAEIRVQQAQAASVGTQPSVSFLSSPLGTSIDISMIALLAAGAVVVWLVARG